MGRAVNGFTDPLFMAATLGQQTDDRLARTSIGDHTVRMDTFTFGHARREGPEPTNLLEMQ